mgnify:CR=1 FL=1
MKNTKSLDIFEHFQNFEFFKKGSKFFVNGQVGNWYKYFSKELSNKFDDVISKNLKYKENIDYGHSIENIEK